MSNEPVAKVAAGGDAGYGLVFKCRGTDWPAVGTALYTHPAPQPAGISDAVALLKAAVVRAEQRREGQIDVEVVLAAIAKATGQEGKV